MGWYNAYEQRVAQASFTLPRQSFRPPKIDPPVATLRGLVPLSRSSGSRSPAFLAAPKVEQSNDPMIPERIDFNLGYQGFGGTHNPQVIKYGTGGKPELDPVTGAIQKVAADTTSWLGEQAARDTKGDLWGSIVGAAAAQGKNIDPMNLAPYVMERGNKFLRQYLEEHPNDTQAQVAEWFTGWAQGVTEFAAEPIGNLIDSGNRAFMWSKNINRVKLAQYLVTGQDQDWGPLWADTLEIGVPGTYFVREDLARIHEWRQQLAGSLTKEQREDIATQMQMLWETIDLPDQVKDEILRNPTLRGREDIEKMMTRVLGDSGMQPQWSYRADASGLWANMANPMAYYALMMIGTSRVGGSAGRSLYGGIQTTMVPAGAMGTAEFGGAAVAVARATPGMIPRAKMLAASAREAEQLATTAGRTAQAARAGQIASRYEKVATGLTIPGKAIKGIAAFQRAGFATGMATMPLTTAFNAVARFQGDQAAVEWWDRLNEPGDFSESYNVQLVTGFTVAPLKAIKELNRGILTVAGRPVRVGAKTGQGLAKIFADKDQMHEVMRRMYRMPDRQTFLEEIGPYYEHEGQMYDEVVGLAADYVLDTRPHVEREQLLSQYPDPTDRTRAVLEKYGSQILDVIWKDPDALALRWQEKAWNHHGFSQRFDPHIAALVAQDFRGAKTKSYLFRERTGSVQAYTELLQPDASAMALMLVDEWAVGGRLKTGGRQSLDDLIRMFPALRKYWKNYDLAGKPDMDVATAKEIISLADADYARAAKQNPIYAATGADPILRPDSTTPDYDLAKALGVSEATVKEYVTGTKFDLQRKMLVEKGVVAADKAVAMTDDEVALAAAQYIENTSKPWREMGERVVNAEKRVQELQRHLAELRALTPNQRTAADIERLDQIRRVELPAAERQRKILAKAAEEEADLAVFDKDAQPVVRGFPHVRVVRRLSRDEAGNLPPRFEKRTVVHYTTRENADKILRDGFSPSHDTMLGGSGGMPEGSVFLGEHGSEVMEIMGSEYAQLREADFGPMAILEIELDPGLKILDIPADPTPRALFKHPVISAEMAAEIAEEIKVGPESMFAAKDAAARVAKRHGYDGVRTDGGEVIIWPKEARAKAPDGPAAKALADFDAKVLRPLREERAVLDRVPEGGRTVEHQAQIAQIEQELATHLEILNAVSGRAPLFVEQVALRRSEARSADKVRSMEPRARAGTLTEDDTRWLRSWLINRDKIAHDYHATPVELWEAAMEVADGIEVRSDTYAKWLRAAMERVRFRRILESIDTLNDAAMALDTVHGNGIEGLARLFTRGKHSESQILWNGGAKPISRGMRSAIDKVLRGPATKRAMESVAGEITTARSTDVMTMADYELWRLLDADPGLVGRLPKRYRNTIDQARQDGGYRGTMPDDHTDATSAALLGEGGTDEKWVEAAARLVTEYWRLLDEAEVRTDQFGQPLRRDMSRMRERGGLKKVTDERGITRWVPRDETIPKVYLDEAEAIAAAGDIDGYSVIDGFDPIREMDSRMQMGNLWHAVTSEYPNKSVIIEALTALPEKTYYAVRRKLGASDETLLDPLEDIDFDVRTPEEVASVIRTRVFDDQPPPGVADVVETRLDEAIEAGDTETIRSLSEQFMAAADTVSEPVRTTASRVRNVIGRRRSTEWRRMIKDYGISLVTAPNAAILANPALARGLDVLSILAHGVPGTRVPTVRRALELMRAIEDGEATRLGIGIPFQREAMLAAEAIVKQAVLDGKRAVTNPGVMGTGLDAASLVADDLDLARSLNVHPSRRPSDPGEVHLWIDGVSDVIDIAYDHGNPLGTLQYGFKRRPKDAVVMELQQVPGLAEEFMSRSYLSYGDRANQHALKRAFNWVFGPMSNRVVHASVRQRFIDRAIAKGVDAEVSAEIWNAWQNTSDASREFEIRIDPITGRKELLQGDNPLFGSVRNIDNNRLEGLALQTVERLGIAGTITPEQLLVLKSANINYADLFREAESWTRRTLVDSKRIPLGKQIAEAYGAVAHNAKVTTGYYWFRFLLDIRYHAMNFFEPLILFMGSDGFRVGEVANGLMGQTEGVLRRSDAALANNTGYALARSRFSYAYRSFIRRQPSALRAAVGDFVDDPAFMEQVLREMAESDPQLVNMIANTGGDANALLLAMDEWNERMLKTVTPDDVDGAIEDALVSHRQQTPALNEVYDALAKANADLWKDVHQVFLGNADRSRAERFLNNYLLFWPLSYQIKSTKWLLNVMYSRMGGLPTNAAGAVILGKVSEAHRQMLATDPEYADWVESNETIFYLTKMLLPITPDSIGVTLSPVARALVPGGTTKAIWDIGPIWTVDHAIRPAGRELGATLYPTLKDWPGDIGRGAFGLLTGMDINTFKPSDRQMAKDAAAAKARRVFTEPFPLDRG